jgi:hypothetical protein
MGSLPTVGRNHENLQAGEFGSLKAKHRSIMAKIHILSRLLLLSAATLAPQCALAQSETNSVSFQGSSSACTVNPWIDISCFGGRAVATAATATATYDGSNVVTLSGASTFRNGDGISIIGAGATNSAAQPAFPSVAATLARTGMGTGAVVPGIAGSTAYSYCIVGRDEGQGLTACSDSSCPTTCRGQITTGAATLGPVKTKITSLSRSNDRVTVRTTRPHGIAAGAEVFVTNTSDASFSGYYQVASVPDATHFTYLQGIDTRAENNVSTSATGGTVTVYSANTLTIPDKLYQYYVYKKKGMNFLFAGIVRPGETTWDDFGQAPPARPAWVPNIAPKTATSDTLTTTVLSGERTIHLTLAKTAVQSGSGTAIFDDGPALKAAYAAAASNATSSGVRISTPLGPFLSYPINSFTALSGGLPVKILQAAAIGLNDTVSTPRGTFWDGVTGGSRGSAPAFSYGAGQSVYVGTAYPGIAADGSSSNFSNLAFIAVFDQGLMMTMRPGGQSDAFEFDSWVINGDTDTMGMAIVGYGTTQVSFRHMLFETNDKGGFGYSLTPLVYFRDDLIGRNGSGNMSCDDCFWVGRGYLNETFPTLTGSNSHYIFRNNYSQAMLTPNYTFGQLNAPQIRIEGHTNDTSSSPVVAVLASPTANIEILDAEDNGVEDGGGGISGFLSGIPVSGLNVIGPMFHLGQNTNLSHFRSHTTLQGLSTTNAEGSIQVFNAPVSIGPNYPLFWSMATPTGLSTTVSAGGFVPVGTWSYHVLATDFAGRSTVVSPTSGGPCVTTAGYQTTPGNQTCTTRYDAVVGAKDYSTYRARGDAGTDYNGVNACQHVPSLSCVDAASVSGSGSPPAATTAGSTSVGSTGIFTGDLRASGHVKAAVYQTVGNCASSASPAPCGSSSAGSVAIASGRSSVVVHTSAVDKNSIIILTFDSSLSGKLGVTCNTTAQILYVTARTSGEGFTLSVPANFVTDPGCASYQIIN